MPFTVTRQWRNFPTIFPREFMRNFVVFSAEQSKEVWMSRKMIYSVFILIMFSVNTVTCEVTAWLMFGNEIQILFVSGFVS